MLRAGHTACGYAAAASRVGLAKGLNEDELEYGSCVYGLVDQCNAIHSNGI